MKDIEKDKYESGGVKRQRSIQDGRYDLLSPYAIWRIAIRAAEGAEKYGDRNWEKGLPMSRFLDSALRHLMKYMMGDTSEDHLAAAAWNIMALIHYENTGLADKWDDIHTA